MKKIFVTGASSGIGLAIARLLLAEGHEVWSTSRNLERIPRMPRCHPVRLDLTDRRNVGGANEMANHRKQASKENDVDHERHAPPKPITEQTKDERPDRSHRQ